ncbi:G5P family DNA-binding protein, partial [Vibrio vulnificus]
MIKIEIFSEDVRINTRTTKAKDDKPSREIYEQDAYVYLGGKFPVQMKLQLEKGQE